jgi:hypothetical protein
MAYIIIIAILLRLLIAVITAIWPGVSRWYRRLRGRIRKQATADIFDNSFIDVKAFFMREFNQVPCISFVNNVDVNKAFEFISAGHAGKVAALYQSTYFNWQLNRQEFETTVFRLENRVLIELGNDYAEILFTNDRFDYAKKLVETLTGFKAVKEKANEINIITISKSGLDLKQLQIKPVELDIDLYYNDDFKPIDGLIKERLGRENDKGIVLLHGLSGTGKTTYLRHLIACIRKKVLFVSPDVAGQLMNPDFIDLLIDHPNSVLVIEDAEQLIMERKHNSYSNVSNLLNISDGLLSDCLNVQIICTFNSALHLVDHALMRKGRLIARYEFGKLNVEKAQRLSNHLGLEQKIDKPMSLAEITNPDMEGTETPKIQVIGFRRMEELMEN